MIRATRKHEEGIRLIAVSPGAVETERLVTLMKTRAADKLDDPKRWRAFMKGLPLGRPASVEEVANAVVFAASGRASYLSGTVITVDGGHNARRGVYLIAPPVGGKARLDPCRARRALYGDAREGFSVVPAMGL